MSICRDRRQGLPEFSASGLTHTKPPRPTTRSRVFLCPDHFNTGQSSLAVQDLAEATQTGLPRRPGFHPSSRRGDECQPDARPTKRVAAFQSCPNCRTLSRCGVGPGDANDGTAVSAGRQRRGARVAGGTGLKLGAHLSSGAVLCDQPIGHQHQKGFLSHQRRGHRFLRPVAEVRTAIEEHHATLKSLIQSTILMARVSDAELANYMERVKLHGEEAALTWLKAKHGTP